MQLLVYLEGNSDIKYPKCDSQHEIQYVGVIQIYQKPSGQCARTQLLLFTGDTYTHTLPKENQIKNLRN